MSHSGEGLWWIIPRIFFELFWSISLCTFWNFVFIEKELSYWYYECIISFILSRDLKLVRSSTYINDPTNSFFIRLNLITFRNESFWITMNLRAKRIFKWIKLEVYKIIIWNGQNESKGEQQTWLQRVVIFKWIEENLIEIGLGKFINSRIAEMNQNLVY